MSKIPKSKDDFKVGDTVYFYEYDDAHTTGNIGQWSRIQSAKVTRITPRFCEVDSGNGNLVKKKKENLFLNRDKAEILFFKFFEARFKEDFNVDLFEVVDTFKRQANKFPELFI